MFCSSVTGETIWAPLQRTYRRVGIQWSRLLQEKDSPTPAINVMIVVECAWMVKLLANELERPRQRLTVACCAVSKAELVNAIGSTPLHIAS